MLFQLSPNTPQFKVFSLLNKELIYFIEKSVVDGTFCRELFTGGAVGQACWENSKNNNVKAKTDLTHDKFKKLYEALQDQPKTIRKKLLRTIKKNQNLQAFFDNPNAALLAFLPQACFEPLKTITTHLYCATKDLQGVLNVVGGVDIKAHFESFRAREVNGNICKSCGMEELAVFRSALPKGAQWRADYDHQLCKSKYPIFSVHPDNLIPLCSVCNQDAKKGKDLFITSLNQTRHAFYPIKESAHSFVDIEVDLLRDPEPEITVEWATNDPALLEKLKTWDDVYEIKRRVEGRFRSLEVIIRNEINPTSYIHFQQQVSDRSRPVHADVLGDKEWAFWYQKLFYKLNLLDKAPFWEKSRFNDPQADEGSDYILEIT